MTASAGLVDANRARIQRRKGNRDGLPDRVAREGQRRPEKMRARIERRCHRPAELGPVVHAELPEVGVEQPRLGAAALNKLAVIEIDDAVEHGAGKGQGPVVDLGRDLRHPPRIRCDPDLCLGAGFGEAVEFVVKQQVSIRAAQQPLHRQSKFRKDMSDTRSDNASERGK